MYLNVKDILHALLTARRKNGEIKSKTIFQNVIYLFILVNYQLKTWI